jgi:hypothetical protein
VCVSACVSVFVSVCLTLTKVRCESTMKLFSTAKDCRRQFSAAHGVTLGRELSNLLVDGSHHTCSLYDGHKDRNGVPWGGCLNSSQGTGEAANCELIFLASPLFEHLRKTSNQTGSSNNKQGFIFLKRDTVPGEELRWKYSVAQAHRDSQPPSPSIVIPSPIVATKRNHSSLNSAKKLFKDTVTPSANSAAVFKIQTKKAAHDCRHHTQCVPGKCSDCNCSECTATRPVRGIPRVRQHAHDCRHHTQCVPGKCSDCNCSECTATRPVSGIPRVRQPKKLE